MKFLSIDVGIKNLSFCLFDKEFNILVWDNINLTNKEEYKCIFKEKEMVCGKEAKFTKDDKCYCLKHAKKIEYLLPISDLKLAFLNKQKIQQLYEIADKYKIIYNKKCKKSDILPLLLEYSNLHCLQNIQVNNAVKLDLVSIGKNIVYKFDLIFSSHISSLDTIIIENQIGPLAIKMKTIQGMLAQYFIMKKNDIKIEFISSSNKLRDVLKTSNNKIDYKQRKQLGINTTIDIINKNVNNNYKQYLEFLLLHKKKDDLCDCFLQGMWYINHKLIT